ncbi:SPOR domain-containing protein [Solemya velesiana gill symbiont]|uniref:SPOR domain-containing protein n=1 Tax=Solemya velesiana gill symbiont TaxID=1918948 RepID=A0A1T2KP02_9GAMM|nr:SPOR domain-containing protein [Solemya velesiana gill symbiont]OOZ34618.1 hypothetical protein BOW51_12015 [Solemya velesiana gill symbiont]
MRWLFLLVLLANIAIFIWGYSSENEEVAQLSPVVSAGIGNIKLLSERQGAGVDPGQEPPSLLADSDSQPQQEPPAAMATGMADQVPQQEIAEPDDQETAGETSRENLQEEGDQEDSGEALVAKADDDVPVEEKREIPPYCGVLGPFEKEEAAIAISENLNKLGFEALRRQQSIIKTTGYWVLIPAADSQQEAIKSLEALKTKGFRDVRRFLQGSLRNTISLGAFSRRENAQARQREVEAKGFKVEVRPRSSESVIHWIDVRLEGEGAGRASATLRENYPALKIREQACSRVVRL